MPDINNIDIFAREWDVTPHGILHSYVVQERGVGTTLGWYKETPTGWVATSFDGEEKEFDLLHPDHRHEAHRPVVKAIWTWLLHG